MKSPISSRIAVATLACLAVIALSSCNKKTDESATTNSQNSTDTSSTTSSPSAGTATSPGSSTSSASGAQGAAPQGTNCPSNSPIKAVNSKKLGKIALTAKSPAYNKTKPDQCFPDVASAEKAGYKASK